eukprot:TRINITY_DN27620_c0_g1_i1.p1 TRINITY_DN27620_c0_g1~~TRINITY_DN27620_c0_g1_i1.p1  ORF type:complete len:266 (+),score=28.39 TRINITY_DN27620_c0_g1_i1:79-876(+)
MVACMDNGWDWLREAESRPRVESDDHSGAAPVTLSCQSFSDAAVEVQLARAAELAGPLALSGIDILCFLGSSWKDAVRSRMEASGFYKGVLGAEEDTVNQDSRIFVYVRSMRFDVLEAKAQRAGSSGVLLRDRATGQLIGLLVTPDSSESSDEDRFRHGLGLPAEIDIRRVAFLHCNCDGRKGIRETQAPGISWLEGVYPAIGYSTSHFVRACEEVTTCAPGTLTGQTPEGVHRGTGVFHWTADCVPQRGRPHLPSMDSGTCDFD